MNNDSAVGKKTEVDMQKNILRFIKKYFKLKNRQKFEFFNNDRNNQRDKVKTNAILLSHQTTLRLRK